MTTREALVKARKLIEDPKRWAQGDYAFGLNGEGDSRSVPPDSPSACRWCAAGAIAAAEGMDVPYCESAYVLARAIAPGAAPGSDGSDVIELIADFNDDPERTHADVLAAFDEAIAECAA